LSAKEPSAETMGIQVVSRTHSKLDLNPTLNPLKALDSLWTMRLASTPKKCCQKSTSAFACQPAGRMFEWVRLRLRGNRRARKTGDKRLCPDARQSRGGMYP
jgi:hypothetical protein